MISLTLFNAIYYGLRSPVAIFIAAALGTLGAHALFYILLDQGKRKKLARMADEAAERQAIIPLLKAENSDYRRRNDTLAGQNAQLRALIEEASNHGRNWRADVQAIMGGK